MSNNKLLYVDDEFVNLQLFKFNFQKQFELFLAKSGQEALDIIKKEEIPVIISDLKMPGMSGTELVDKIKEKYPDKVCLIVSAYYVDEAKKMGLDESKIFGFISKPWKKENVAAMLNKAFNIAG